MNTKIQLPRNNSGNACNYEQPKTSPGLRLDEIAKPHDGWVQAGGVAPSKDSIEAMRGFTKLIASEPRTLVPYLYPTIEGGVTAEWTVGAWEASATIEADGKKVELHAVNTSFEQNVHTILATDSADLMMNFREFWDLIMTDTKNS
jgi:hypothetical protein